MDRIELGGSIRHRGESATVKKFYRENDGRVRLQPANTAMQPMYFRGNEVTIQGIVIGVMRRY